MEEIISPVIDNITSVHGGVQWPNGTYNDSFYFYDLYGNDTTGMMGGEDDYRDESMAQKILDFLNLYFLGGIICMGLLGNGRNIVMFILSRNELRSPSYYLLAIALADTVFILTILNLWLSRFGFHLFLWPGFYQTFFYLSSTSSCISGECSSLHPSFHPFLH